LAVPLYNLLPSLLSPVALALTPALAAALAARNNEQAHMLTASALRLSNLAALPAALGLGAFSHPLLTLLFRGEEAAVSTAAPLLTLLSLSVLPAVWIALAGAALQAAGRTCQQREPLYDAGDMMNYGLSGGAGSRELRDRLGRKLGIGYGNASAFPQSIFHLSQNENRHFTLYS
jgi:hypothetical protein